MFLTRKYAVAAMMLFALIAVSCSKSSPTVEIDVNPKQLNAPGLVKVTWKTQGLQTTTISSTPSLTGLPKIVTGGSSDTDSFQVNTTTTFQIKGETPGQTAPFTKIASATVTVGGSAPAK